MKTPNSRLLTLSSALLTLGALTLTSVAFNGPPVGCTPESCSTPLIQDFANGRVGIGTATPSDTLEVNGNIIASTPVANNHVATKEYVDAGAGDECHSFLGTTTCPSGWTLDHAVRNGMTEHMNRGKRCSDSYDAYGTPQNTSNCTYLCSSASQYIKFAYSDSFCNDNCDEYRTACYWGDVDNAAICCKD